MDNVEEKVKGEEMEAEEEQRRALPSSPPPLTSLLDSETGKMLPLQDGSLAHPKKSTLEEAVERMKAATTTEGVKSPRADAEEQ